MSMTRATLKIFTNSMTSMRDGRDLILAQTSFEQLDLMGYYNHS